MRRGIQPLTSAPRAPSSTHGSTTAGFTLIEVLVTLLLLSIVLAGLIALQISSIRQVTSSKRVNEATRLAQGLLERHLYLPITLLQTEYTNDSHKTSCGTPGILCCVGSGIRWCTLAKRDPTQPMANVGVDGEGPGPYSAHRIIEASGSEFIVTIRVSWQDHMPGATIDPAVPAKTLDVLMSCRRSL